MPTAYIWESKMAFGDNLKRLRRDKGWTQAQIADAADLKITHITKLEKPDADPKLSTIEKLLNALGCSPNALLNDVATTSLEGRVAMALERVQQLPDEEKNTLLDVVDKYCIAVHMQSLMDNQSTNNLFGFMRSAGRTQELASKGK